MPFDPEKADVWALGITMFAEITGVYPWMVASLDTHFYRQWVSSYSLYPDAADLSPNEVSTIWQHAIGSIASTRKGTPLSVDFMRLMRGMLHPDSTARLTLAEVSSSTFFRLRSPISVVTMAASSEALPSSVTATAW